MHKILDARPLAKIIKSQVAQEVESFKQQTGIIPGLCVILASDDAASQIYVKKKRDACREVGMESLLIKKTGPNTEEFVANTLNLWHGNDKQYRENYHGVLLQLPIPDVEDSRRFYDLIPPLYDVDVLHPENIGLLAQGRPRFKTCTPQGILELLNHYDIPVMGKSICLINDSDLVGKPFLHLASSLGATVTMCHKRTPWEHLKRRCLQSDIIVVAVGKPGFITCDMVHEGSVIIDVGINRLDNASIVGDVSAEAQQIVASYSPVPGGVGLLTVAVLLRNTIQAARLQIYGK